MTEVIIDSHIRIPRAKGAIRDDERRRKLFRRYSDKYQALHIRRPDRYTFDSSTEIMRIYTGNSVCEAASERRIEQQIRMMQSRINDRG